MDKRIRLCLMIRKNSYGGYELISRRFKKIVSSSCDWRSISKAKANLEGRGDMSPAECYYYYRLGQVVTP